MRTTSSRILLGLTAALLLAGPLVAAPAQARPVAPVSPVGAAPDPGPVRLFDRASPTAVFTVPLPPGGRLRALRPGGEVLVLTAAGVVVGAYDSPWAADAFGRPLRTTYRVEGARLVQTVRVGRFTRFPITLDPIRSTVGAGQTRDGEEPVTFVGAAARPAKVTVPANYVYNPALGVLHDYCTASPDEFPAPGAPNADFRGPCARHDLCYAGSTSEFTCDNRLLADLRQNCAHYYDPHTALLATCRATALVYWAAVVAT
jgi:hypothetical protein